MRIPLFQPTLGGAEERAALRVLRSGRLSKGPATEALEGALMRLLNVRHVRAVNSGTSALLLALLALRRKGDVVVPAFTFPATGSSVVLAGLRLRFADVSADTGHATAETLEAAATRSTVAVLPVHFAGLPCDMGPIADLAEKRGWGLVEDAAESLGAECDGRSAGTFGTGCFSLHATKQITSGGEGGAIATDSAAIAKRVDALRSHGILYRASWMKERPWRRVAAEPGYNLRIPDICAAVGEVQVKRLPGLLAQRRRNAAWLRRRLEDLPGLRLPPEPGNRTHAYWLFHAVLEPEADRDRVILELRGRSIEASVYFDPPLYRMPAFRAAARCPNAELLAARSIALPVGPWLRREGLEAMVSALEEALRKWA